MSRVDIIELLDGRLYQWDTGRRVALHPLAGQTADEVHFSNNGKDALVVKPALEGSVLVASIPNILLQEAKNVAAYAVMVSDTGERTTYGRNLPVFPRAKPADYAYTETELADYKALEARVAALEKSGGGGGATVVDGAVVSSGSDYAICFEWHDGNPDKEDRRNRFVQLSDGGSKITFATSDADICGVTTDTAAFVENYDIASEHTSLCGILGVVTVIDNGTCTIGGTCMSDDNGYAIPSINNMGYRVMERLDENKIRIAVKPNDDMVQRIKRDMDNKVDFGKQQELSEDQKSQARENIDAASKKDISSLSGKIDSIPSGKDGADGQDGITPTIGDNGNWYLGDTDTGKPSRGEPGQDGSPGAAGADGYTPVKGTDYFTDADKQEIAEAAAGMVSIPDKLPNPNALTFTGAVDATYDGSEDVTVTIPSGGGGLSDFELIDTLDWSTEELAQAGAVKEYTFAEIQDICLVYTGLANVTSTASGLGVNVNGQGLQTSAEPVSGKSETPLNGYVFLHAIPGIGIFSLRSPGANSSTNYGQTNAQISYNLHPVIGKITKFRIVNRSYTYITNTGILKIYAR